MNGYQESDLLLGGIGAGAIIFGILGFIIGIVVLWRIYDKAGEPGWASLVPFYNMYVLFKITWGNGILFLLLLIPFANLIIAIILPFKLAKAFGRGVGFGFGLLLLPIIFFPILAFGNSAYVGVDLKQQQNPPVLQQQIIIQTPQANSAYPQQSGYAQPQPNAAIPPQANSAYPQQSGYAQPQPNAAIPPQANSAYPQQSGYAQPQPNAAYAQAQQAPAPGQQPYYPYPQQYCPQGQSAYPQSPYGYPPQQQPYPQNFPPSQPANGTGCPVCGNINPLQTTVCQRCGNRIA